MDSTAKIIGLTIAIGLSSFLLIVRKKSWCTINFRFGLTGLLFIIGLIGMHYLDNLTKDQRFFYILIQIPLINTLFDKFFKFLSLKIQNRDFLLYMRGSEDLDKYQKNPELKTSDYVFSIILIILLFTLPLIGL